MPTRPPAPAWLRWGLFCLLAALTGCASTKFTVDDGRPVNEQLLADLQRYGRVERAARPAIRRSAELKDAGCDRQWELPMVVASSQSWSADDRVAWVRALGVDERLTVVAHSPGSPLQPGDRIVQVGGTREDNAERLGEALAEARDRGKPFKVTLADSRQVALTPFQVCRGYTRFAPPNSPRSQDFHWLMSLHPLDLGDAALTEDEALWIVLWTQGLSEEGGARMKTWHYGTQVVGTLYNLFTIASGLRGAALAADAAIRTAQEAATRAATDLLRNQIISQARDLAMQRLQDGFTEAGQKLLNQQAAAVMQQAAANRGALGGVARVGATAFDRADAWAWQRMPTLGANPLAGYTLHQKLVERGLADSAFVFDVERLTALTTRAEADGQGEAVLAALRGIPPARLAQALEGMPLASARKAFSYDEPIDAAGASPFANGLIDASLSLPIESRK